MEVRIRANIWVAGAIVSTLQFFQQVRVLVYSSYGEAYVHTLSSLLWATRLDTDHNKDIGESHFPRMMFGPRQVPMDNDDRPATS